MSLNSPDQERIVELNEAQLAERPGDDAAHERLARALFALGHLEEAERHAADAVRLDPDEARYRELLAQVLAARGAHRDAAAEFARLAQRDPRQIAWTLAEASARLEGAELAASVEAARRAARLAPDNADAQLTLARGLTQVGDGPAALQAATRAADLRPGDPAPREALADALWLNDRPTAAFAVYRELAGGSARDAAARVTAKARTLYRQRSDGAGRAITSVGFLFTIALRRGWLRLK